MKKIGIAFLLLGLLVVNNCSNAKSQFEKGNYEKAVQLAIKRLRKNPNNKKQQIVLKAAYTYAQTIGEQKAKQYEQLQTLEKHDLLIAHYRQLQNLYTALLTCPGCMAVVTPVDYQQLLTKALQMGAKAYADEGKSLLSSSSKSDARTAFKFLQKANIFIPNTVDRMVLDSAQIQGTESIGITPIPVASQGLQLNSAFFQQQLVQALNAMRYPFADFRPIQAFINANSTPDWIVELSFDDYVVGQTYLKETRETLVRDSVAIGSVRDSLGNKQTVYGTVEADVQKFEKTIESGGLLNIAVRSTQNNNLRFQRKLPSTYTWINDWLTYQGDKRALAKKELHMAKAKEELPPPPQVLFQAFTEPLFHRTIQELRREFRYLKK